MLRYLRRVEHLTVGRLRWGVLTNGACWRLYYQGARSISTDSFEFDFRPILGLAGFGTELFSVSDDVRRHCLRVMALVLRREAFLPVGADPRKFYQRVMDESRYYEAKVASDISDLVFGKVFPEPARAIAEAAPDASMGEVRESTLVLLYRLLFKHYAEDRGLLPIHDRRYRHWDVRRHVREDVGRRKSEGDVFSRVFTRSWRFLDDLSRLIDAGDVSMGLPPYDGGLCDRQRVPPLSRIRLCDAVMAEVIAALTFKGLASAG